MEFNIDELRKAKRPLWMTPLGVESVADLLGGGGDYRTDRLAPDWDRATGEEVEVEGDGKETEYLLAGKGVGEDYKS